MVIHPTRWGTILATALVCAWTPVAHALEDFTNYGQQLARWAAAWEGATQAGGRAHDTTSALDIEFFQGFVAGVAFTTVNRAWCPVGTYSLSQLSAVSAKYLRDHPERWSERADQLVLEGLVGAFPCRRR